MAVERRKMTWSLLIRNVGVPRGMQYGDEMRVKLWITWMRVRMQEGMLLPAASWHRIDHVWSHVPRRASGNYRRSSLLFPTPITVTHHEHPDFTAAL